MRIAFTFVLALCVIAQSHGLAITDTIQNVEVSGKIQFANGGLAPVPAFSFNSPIVFGFLSIKKKGFSFEPDAAVGLNGKPWMTNYWFRFKLSRKKWNANVGVNPSLFFENQTLSSGDEVIHIQRNLTFEACAEYKIGGNKLRLLYMAIRGCDLGTLSGHFFDLQSEFTAAQIRNKLSLSFKPQIFYFNFDSLIDGFFVAGRLDVKYAAIPVSFFSQGVLPLWAAFPGTGFKWNFGMLISL